MKIALVSQRVHQFNEIREKRDCLDTRLIEWLKACNVISYPIPNLYGRSNLSKFFKTWINNLKPSMIILSGGNDIGECKLRDELELKLLKYAKENKIPLLGICRGMQIIGKWAGIKLKRVNGHTKTKHKIIGLIEGQVNSYHNYSLIKCPNDFVIIAKSIDGEIEAIKHTSLPWEGWMWHPEREKKFKNLFIKRFKRLIS